MTVCGFTFFLGRTRQMHLDPYKGKLENAFLTKRKNFCKIARKISLRKTAKNAAKPRRQADATDSCGRENYEFFQMQTRIGCHKSRNMLYFVMT